MSDDIGKERYFCAISALKALVKSSEALVGSCVIGNEDEGSEEREMGENSEEMFFDVDAMIQCRIDVENARKMIVQAERGSV